MSAPLRRDRRGLLSRRSLLRSASAAALAAGLGAGCPVRREPETAALAPAPELAPGGRAAWADAAAAPLARVEVAAEREIRTVVGLRPFRATGFRVEVERLDDKVLVHNYGHGGAGITLSWGTSQLAVEDGLQAVAEAGVSAGWGDAALGNVAAAANGSCAVIGCGVVGLSTARLMQRQGWHVTIYARELPPHTTSNVAGGFWSPHALSDPGRTTARYEARFLRAARIAHRDFQGMVGDDYAVRWIRSYMLSETPIGEPMFRIGTEDLYPETRILGREDYPFARDYGATFTTLLIEPHRYLDALLRDFRVASGQIVVRELHDLREVAALPHPLIFNCTGLGARALVGDMEMEPIRGQLTFLLPQPQVDYTVLADDLYMFPRSDGILLGGTHERGDWSLEPDPAARRRIIAAHRALFGWTDGGATGR